MFDYCFLRNGADRQQFSALKVEDGPIYLENGYPLTLHGEYEPGKGKTSREKKCEETAREDRGEVHSSDLAPL